MMEQIQHANNAIHRVKHAHLKICLRALRAHHLNSEV
jgi:hypothetical protein